MIPEVVRRLQSFEDLTAQCPDLVDRQGSPGQALTQGLAVDELHHDDRLVTTLEHLVHGADERMAPRRGSTRFTKQPDAGGSVLDALGRDELQSDDAVQRRIVSAANLAHAPAANQPQVTVATNLVSITERQMIRPGRGANRAAALVPETDERSCDTDGRLRWAPIGAREIPSAVATVRHGAAVPYGESNAARRIAIASRPPRCNGWVDGCRRVRRANHQIESAALRQS